jgi:hypothetical protein
MRAIEKLKEMLYSVEINSGNYYAQDARLEFFATQSEAEAYYDSATISTREMDEAKWSRDGEQPTFSIELRALEYVPADKLEELNEELTEDNMPDLLDITHTYSNRVCTKEYIFNKDSFISHWDSEEEAEEKRLIDRWQLVEYEGSRYATIAFSEVVVSIATGAKSIIKGAIE